MDRGFNRQIYDSCSFQQRTFTSVAPFDYMMYRGAHVNCGRCHYNQPKYVSLVDTESELKNITRLQSKCAQLKYSPGCKNTISGQGGCLATLDPRVPVVLPPEVCPDYEKYIYFNNGLKRPTNPGYVLPTPSVCRKKMMIMKA